MSVTVHVERLLLAATNFAALAEVAEGPELRGLIEPWLKGATFDKRSRVLTLAIYPVPSFQLYNSPGQVVQLKSLTRRIHVPTGRRVSA